MKCFRGPFELVQPYGIAVDSKGNLYIADQKVGAIFIFNTETRDVDLIKNTVHAHFVRIIGLAMDDSDRLFVSDPGLRHVLVFNKDHKPEDVITEGMVDPGGFAIDTQNRLLYVADVQLDQVLVYDADTLKPLRKIGTTGHNHELTTPGDFSKPAAVPWTRKAICTSPIPIITASRSLTRTANLSAPLGKTAMDPDTFAA